MILLQQEESALQEFVVSLVQSELDRMLCNAACPAIAAFSDSAKGMIVIAYDLTIHLRGCPQYLVPLLSQIVKYYPHVPSAPHFRAAIIRLQQAGAAQAAIPPWEACLASGVPIVNRSMLRQLLRGLVSGASHPVVLIEGANGTGRSHSWRLIKHVADAVGSTIMTCKVDLTGYVAEHQTVERVFDSLVKQLQLQVACPTYVAATPETVAARYADELAHQWGQLGGRRIWLVFDSLDRDIPTEIKRFVSNLAEHRLDQRLNGATLFLLGAGRGFIVDPYRLAKLEQLGSFVERELREIAQLINAAGLNPLSVAQLEPRIQDLTEAMQVSGFSAVAERLTDLRDEVCA